jgi:hypothetical protein
MNSPLLTKSQWPLLLGLFLAPACSPNEKTLQADHDSPQPHLVLLTDAERWPDQDLTRLKDSLREANYRVIISGYAGENAEDLLQRLPWLLQPGVDLLLCDPRFLPPAGMDSLRSFLREKQLAIDVRPLVGY